MKRRTSLLAAASAVVLLAGPLAFAPPALAGIPIGADLHAYAKPRTLTILAVGAALAATSLPVENPNRQAAFFENGSLDGPSDFGNQYGSGVTLAALSGVFLGAGLLAHDHGLKQTGGEMIRSLAYTSVAVTAAKVAFHRTRPNGGPYSFPSGHTAAAFAVAPILASRLGWSVGIPAYLLAGATGMGRMEEKKHYLSDVVFGAAVGLSIGLAVSGHGHAGPEKAASGSTAGSASGPARFELGASPAGAAIAYHF